jgi:hypothetical protein
MDRFARMGIFSGWLDDPQASASLAIALIAGTWAVAQFRPLARERRRETYEAMADHYADLHAARSAAVPRFPALLAIGRDSVLEAAEAAGGRHAEAVAREAERWSRFDISFTSAREVLQSEAKFRALLHAIELIGRWRAEKELVLDGKRLPVEILKAAETLAHDANVFLFHYENGNYPARQTLGLLHRSLAVVSKVTEPVVWEKSVHADARWGRRALRIGLAAQHFNDVTQLHCTSDLTWNGDGLSHLIHPRLRQETAGASVLTDSPIRPRLLPALRIRIRFWYWFAVGILSPVPKVSFLSYGGRRLRDHRRYENRVADLLGIALANGSVPDRQVSLDFDWNLGTLKMQQRNRAQAQRRRIGRFAWLWLPRDPHAGI